MSQANPIIDDGFVEGGGPVDYNGSVTLEVIANRGYKFTGWDDGSN